MENESKKSGIYVSKGLLIFIIIAFIGCIGIIVYQNFIKTDKMIDITQPEITASEEIKNSVTASEQSVSENNINENIVVNSYEKSVNKIENNKELVYNVKTEVKNYFEEKDLEIEIPQINLNYDNIKALNDKIFEYAKKISIYGRFESKYYINDGIISIVLTYYTEGDPYDIFVYNVDSHTGNILTNEELLYQKGIEYEDIKEKIEKAEEKVFTEHNVKNYEFEGIDWAWISRGYNDYSSELQINIPMFINENGKLSVIIEYSVPAGSGGPWGIIVEL